MTNEQIIKAFHDENTVFTTVSEDTFRNMPWNSFTELLKSNGFKKGLEYMFWCGAECHEVIYYRNVRKAHSFRGGMDSNINQNRF